MLRGGGGPPVLPNITLEFTPDVNQLNWFWTGPGDPDNWLIQSSDDNIENWIDVDTLSGPDREWDVPINDLYYRIFARDGVGTPVANVSNSVFAFAP